MPVEVDSCKRGAHLRRLSMRLNMVSYYPAMRARYQGTAVLHLATDAARSGGRDTQVTLAFSKLAGLAAWLPTVDGSLIIDGSDGLNGQEA